ncbi:MAG: SRPBCC family protein [Chitinophagaceae bacterium]|nr:SRPBCC family protein [Chitinophagaceae bacterium]
MAVFTRVHQQLIPAHRSDVWKYLSRSRHLLDLTPAHFHLRIVDDDLPEYIHEGLNINYTMVFLGIIRTRWISKITAAEYEVYFIDEQPRGPFASWHHEHRLQDHPDGTLMTDSIQVEPPFGWLGFILYHVWIKHQLDRNMMYRTKVITNYFKHV